MTSQFLSSPIVHSLQFLMACVVSWFEDMAAQRDFRRRRRAAAKRMPRLLVYPEWDKDKPTRAWAFNCVEAALQIYWEDGDKTAIQQARNLFRGALSSGADPKIIFNEWIGMELSHRDVAAARACYEEWRWRAGGCRGDTDFWCGYINFEAERDKGKRWRDVAAAAMWACPRDPVLFALRAKLEVRQGHNGRARSIVRGALQTLTVDVYPDEEEAARWVADEVERYRQYLRDEAAKRPTIVDIVCYMLCGEELPRRYGGRRA